MNPERWQQVRELLDRALALQDFERATFLDQACAGDSELRAEVESLLDSHERAGSVFLKKPAFDIKVSTAANRVGHRVGVYRLIEQVGQGGMGEVYRAERADGQYDKQVAIKFVRAGYDTAAIIERFRNERQVLASLDHPNIARLLDGGTTEDGVPYLVMELIEGTPIDQYCQMHQLVIPERLRLFQQVASAVQYAHQHLVIHRDIKPGNILVTSQGVPKLLDFGIAKILDPSAASQQTAINPMTPEYASPEQIRGEPVTTATDVYSLGVVLYQLLTERSPYPKDMHTPHELARAICEYEPERPSSVILKSAPHAETAQPAQRHSLARQESSARLRRSLRGDLDTILLRAMHKDRQRRYASVEQFSGDIQRHLEGRPVIARRDSWTYRAGKFAVRHKFGVSATALILLAIAAGVAATIREARVAAANERRAEDRFNDVRKLANSLMFELHDSIRDLPGSTPARKLLVSRALEYLDRLSADAKTDASLQRELATGYERIGDVQGLPRQANLGDPAGAAVSYRKALAIRESLARADPNDLEVRRQLCPNYGRLGDLLLSTGDSKAAIEYSQKGLVLARALSEGSKATAADQLMFAMYRMDFGFKQVFMAIDRTAGLDNMRNGAASLEQMLVRDPRNQRARRTLSLAYSRLAGFLADDNASHPEAMSLYKKAIATKEPLLEADPNNVEIQRLITYDKFGLAQLLANMNQDDAALQQDTEALSEFEKYAKADPQNVQLQLDIGTVHQHMGQTFFGQGKHALALEQLGLSLGGLDKLPDANNTHSHLGVMVLTDELWLGKTHVSLASARNISEVQAAQHCREAESWFRKCLPGFEDIRDHAPKWYGGAERVAEIKAERDRCQKTLRREPSPPARRTASPGSTARRNGGSQIPEGSWVRNYLLSSGKPDPRGK
jgi:eukaryotic-like serine/threonine-protein kinase